MEIYDRGWGRPVCGLFTDVIPILLVGNVPARILARPLSPREPWEWWIFAWAAVVTFVSLLASRWLFRKSLLSYRSASS